MNDPISRTVEQDSAPFLADTTPPERLGDAELRRELVNVELALREAPERGILPDLERELDARLAELAAEALRRNQR